MQTTAFRDRYPWLYEVSHGTVAAVVAAAILGLVAAGTAFAKARGDGKEPSGTAEPAVVQEVPAVLIAGALSVLNVSRGESAYEDAVTAMSGEKVALSAWYYNQEDVDSGLYASALTVRFEPSKTRSADQVMYANISGSNTNKVTVSATVRVPEGHVVRLLPDTAEWRHNAGTDLRPRLVTEPVGNEVLARGAVIEDAAPCLACEATVSVLGVVEAL